MLMTLNVAVLLFRPQTPTPLTVSVVGFTEVKLSHSKELRGLHLAPKHPQGALSPRCGQECKILYMYTHLEIAPKSCK